MTTPSVYASPLASGGRASSVAPVQRDVDRPHVLRAKAGDRTAYAPLWDKYWRSLYRYFARQISRREEAEDLASETLLEALDQLPAFRGIADAPTTVAEAEETDALAHQCSFQTYLFTIARYKRNHWIRRKVNRPCQDFSELASADSENEDTSSLEERLGADADADPLHSLLKQDHLDEVCYALADVGMRSSEQFKALFFHYLCDLSHKEVAALLEIRSETINTRLQEGRRTLTRYYQRAAQDTTASSC